MQISSLFQQAVSTGDLFSPRSSPGFRNVKSMDSLNNKFFFCFQSAVALFDMIEFYDSTCQLNISFNKNIGLRGWQACSKLIRRVGSLSDIDLSVAWSLSACIVPCHIVRCSVWNHSLQDHTLSSSKAPLISTLLPDDEEGMKIERDFQFHDH